MSPLHKNHPESIVYCVEHEPPIEIETCSAAGGVTITRTIGLRYHDVSVTAGEPSQGLIYEADVIQNGSTGDCTVLQGNILCEDLNMTIAYNKAQGHSFTIECEGTRRFPLSFTHAQLKVVTAKARGYAEGKAKEMRVRERGREVGRERAAREGGASGQRERAARAGGASGRRERAERV